MITPIIDKKISTPLYMQIRSFIVEAINEGHLQKGDRMPSVRSFAKHLSLSCTTIENAYNQLMAEGYIDSKPGKGFYVENIDGLIEISEHTIELRDERVKPSYKYDFASEFISSNAFDFKVWKKHVNHVLNYDQESLCAYGDVRGELPLRQAVSRQFYRSRGLIASPDQIVIGGGVTPLIAMLSHLLQTKGIDGVSLENPGFRKAYGVFLASGMRVTALDVSLEGVETSILESGDSRACYVSPSHHFPTGFIMPVSERQKILKWANSCDGYVIEDDYNFELRFEGQPIPAMQGMDPNKRVIYLGSFSTVLAPAIRISFMVLPNELNQLFEKNEGMFPQTSSKIEQLALAKFIDSGDFEKHIRKIRNLYTKKQHDLLGYIQTHIHSDIQPMKVKSGLQILLKLPKNCEEDALIQSCASRGVKIEGLSHYCRGLYLPSDYYIIIGYRGIEASLIEEGIRIIGEVAQRLYEESSPSMN